MVAHQLNQEDRRKRKAIDTLETLLPIFYESVKTGFNEYYRANEGKTYKYRPTTRANIIYDNIIFNLKKKLITDQSTAFIQKNGLLIVKVCDKYLIKIKKLDDNHKSSNVATKQNTLFKEQGTLFDLGDSLENLEIGYVFNKSESDINGVFVVCPKNEKENDWELDLDEYLMNKSSTTLFTPPDSLQAEKKQRFKVKKKKQDNSDGAIQQEKIG